MKRFFAVLLTVCLFFSLSGCAFFESRMQKTEYSQLIAEFEGDVGTIPHYYSQLTDTEKAAYINIVNTINASSQVAQVPGINSDSLQNVTTAVSYDNPHFLWLEKEWTITHYSTGASIEIPYLYTAEERQNMSNELEEKVNKIMRGINAAMGDYEKELYFHDYLVKNCAYDNYAQSDSDYSNSYTAYGALVEGKAVCEGYARAMQLLLKEAGIESFLVPGTALSQYGSTVNHMWNAVKINSEWYHLDATWNDPQSAGPSNAVWHTYFNLSDEEILRDHSYEVHTDCTSTSANYYKKNSLHFSSFNSSDFANTLADEFYTAKRTNSNFIEVRFANYDDFAKAKSELTTGQLIYVAISRANTKYKTNMSVSAVSYSTFDKQCVIGIKFS